MSTDEKLTTILSELYKLSDGLKTVQRSTATMQQQLDMHEQELQVLVQNSSLNSDEDDERMSQPTEKNKNDIINLFNEDHSLGERLSAVENSTQENARSINLLKGTAHRQYKQIQSNQHKIVDLTARSMDHNFTISGLIKTKNKNCKLVVMEFFRDLLGLRFEQDDVLVAHRTGTRNPIARGPRLM